MSRARKASARSPLGTDPAARLLRVADAAPSPQREVARALAEIAGASADPGAAATAHERDLAGVAASVIGPTLAVWVAWLLARMQQRGVSRVFFLSRDGYIPQHFAAKLAGDSPSVARSSYLYVSRQALHFPAINEITPDMRGWLFDRSAGLTPRTVLARLRQPLEDWTAWFRQRGWSGDRLGEVLSAAAEEELWKLFAGDPDFLRRLEPQIRAARADALDYFRAEGFGERDAATGVVDLGWHGRLQDSMRKLFAAAGRQPSLHGFYFALLSGTADAPSFTKDALLFDLRIGQNEFPMIPDVVPLMESFCTAPHGTLKRYARAADGAVAPEFDPAMSASLQGWGLSAVHGALDRFADELGRRRLPLAQLAGLAPLMAQWLSDFSTAPTPEEAEAWGAYPYVDDQAGHGQTALAKRIPVTASNLRSALVFGAPAHFQPDPSDRIQWTGASRVLAARQKPLLDAALRVGRVKVRIGRALKK